MKRLNGVTEQRAGADFASASVFSIDGLKREEPIAAKSWMRATVAAGHSRA